MRDLFELVLATKNMELLDYILSNIKIKDMYMYFDIVLVPELSVKILSKIFIKMKLEYITGHYPLSTVRFNARNIFVKILKKIDILNIPVVRYILYVYSGKQYKECISVSSKNINVLQNIRGLKSINFVLILNKYIPNSRKMYTKIYDKNLHRELLVKNFLNSTRLILHV